MLRKPKNFAHLLEAKLSNLIFGFPAKKMTVIGVTGTDGKTTTSSLIYHILKKSRKKVGLISTIGAKIGSKDFNTGFHTTTPSSFALQRYIRKAYREGLQYLVIEATSHSLDQNRVAGIPFSIGVLTNITHEHLDYHITHEKYLRSKLKLFKNSKICILNMDDASYSILKENLQSKKIYSYSIENTKADTNIENIKYNWDEVADFNKENYLAAITTCRILDVKKDAIVKALPSFKLPEGRQETVYNNGFKVIIDFAHTPHSFEEVLEEVKRKTKGKIIHVFGTAGERDKTKRPIMGGISSKFADIIILTAEDPRYEKIREINRIIKEGIKDLKKVIEIDDRQEAIEKAIKIARKNDVVLVTGKGHEKSMNLGHGEITWSDHEAVRNAIEKRLDLPKARNA